MCGQREELDMELALHMSMEEAHARRIGSNHDGRRGGPSNKSLDELDREIADTEAQVNRLNEYLKLLCKERNDIVKSIRDNDRRGSVKGKEKDTGDIDYEDEFEWTGMIRAKLKSVFGFDSFRQCQEGCAVSLFSLTDNSQYIGL